MEATMIRSTKACIQVPQGSYFKIAGDSPKEKAGGK
jgi:hypothetical protein